MRPSRPSGAWQRAQHGATPIMPNMPITPNIPIRPTTPIMPTMPITPITPARRLAALQRPGDR